MVALPSRVAVVGVGAVGARVARALMATHPGIELVLTDVDRDRLRSVARTLGSAATIEPDGDVHRHEVEAVVIAAACGQHLPMVRAALERGVAAVSTSDRVEDVRAVLGLDRLARERGVTLIAGAGFAPGMTGILARHGASMFDVVDEIHVAKAGTGGPACARQHHRALKTSAIDWRDGAWVQRPGGSGRELVWFPEPLGGADCYRASLPDAVLLQPWFPDASRITARMAASRQDRFTAWLPMLSPPHPEGGTGGVRVELRGRRDGARTVEILGAVERPAVAAAAVAALAVDLVVAGAVGGAGARGLAGVDDARSALRELARRGLRPFLFDGVAD